jgi:cytochrome P450
VRDVLSRPAAFPPSNALTAVTPLSPRALRILNSGGFALPPVLASATGELHARTRRIVAGFFTPATVAALGPTVARLTEQRVQQVNARLNPGPVDLAAGIAHPVPLQIMQQLTGVDCPESIGQWSRDSLELFWGWPTPKRQLELAAGAAALYTWLAERVEADRGTDNLFGALAAAGLASTQICSLGYFLLIAGHQTTALLIATGLYRALADPIRWRALTGGSPARTFVRRLLATESSVPTWRRVATAATELDGYPVPAGSEILLELTGHHPDGAVEQDYGLAFGYGIHRCLGARLAELETCVVIETVARRLDPVVLAGPEPDWLRLLSFQAPRTVAVRRDRP